MLAKKEAPREVIVMRPETHRPRWENALDEASQIPTILIVDDLDLNRRVLKAILKTSDYRILEAKRPSMGLALLEQEKVDLVVVDFMMPEMSGPDFCRLLKGNRATHLIPILMTTGLQGADHEIEGIDSGADEYLVKPLLPSVARTRIRNMLRNKAVIDSLDEAETILFALAQSVEQRDKYTDLHDIGKVGIPDAILFKRGLLSEAEWQVMRQHTLRGEEICRTMKTLAPVLPIIRSHHERWDGSGYPDGLQGEAIPLLARILQVADIYDALTTARPYKPAFSHPHALEIMLEEARRGWRDPELVPLFAEVTQKASGPHAAPWAGEADMHQSLENMRRELTK